MKGSARRRLATEDSFLASRSDRESRHVYEREVLTFGLAGERYGLDIGRMREIVKLRPITEVPRVPDYLVGVISVRGEIAPVIDLRRRLGLPCPKPGKAGRILIAACEGESVGLLVDEVCKVVRLRAADIEEAPAAGVTSALIGGLARFDGELIALLDVLAVVGPPLGGGR